MEKTLNPFQFVEGPKFNLGEVSLVGDNLPREAILKAADLEPGKVANWREIQQKIYATEIPIKRTGYFEAAARPERMPRDEQLLLDLRISFVLGPLYHFNQVTFVGLPPPAEEVARKLWKMETGNPYDLLYSRDFLGAFSKKVDLRGYKVSLNTLKTPDHVGSETLTFSPK